MGSDISIIPQFYSGDGTSIDIIGQTISVNDDFVGEQIAEPIAEHEIEIIELQANASMTPFDHAGLISDTFSDSTGYFNSVNTANTTATFSTNKYIRGAVEPTKWQLKLNDNYLDAYGNHNLTASGSGNSFVAGKINNCLSMNGSGIAQKTGVTGFATGNVNWSASAWVNMTAQPSSNAVQIIAFFGSLGSTRDGFGITYRDESGTKKVYCYQYGESQAIAQTLNNGTWYHIVFTYTASTRKVNHFINGSSIGEVTLGGDMALNVNKISVGGLSAGSTLNGLVDDVRYFESILSQSQIDALYNSGNGTEAGLMSNSDKFVEIDLSTFAGLPATITGTELIVRDADREAGDSIDYTLIDSDSNTDANLALNTKNSFTNIDGTKIQAGKLQINLNKGTAETSGKPAVKTFCLKVW